MQNKGYQNKGVKLGDIVEIYPLRGRKYSFPLLRTKMQIVSSNVETIRRKGFAYEIPAIKDEKFSMELSLENDFEDQEKNVFKLTVVEGDSVRLNGNYVSQAWPSKNSIIDFGYNRVILKSLDEKSEVNPILKYLSAKMINSEANILIEGETGTGKSRLAKKIHQESGRTGKFVHVNLSAFSKTLIESELFGHAKGSFTGAIKERVGAFVEANNGTLFIDELDSVSKEIQTKLLIAIESNQVRPVGAVSSVKTNARIVFASGASLESLVKEDIMRQDFYFRVRTGSKIKLKPLRDDRDLLKKLVTDFAKDSDLILSEELLPFYYGLDWPGNIRQLLSHLEIKKINCSKRVLELDYLDDELSGNGLFIPAFDSEILSLKEMKEKYALKAYHYFNCNLKATSKALNISKNTLRHMVREPKHQLLNECKHLPQSL